MMCAFGVPASISQGRPSPLSALFRWLSVETPIDSDVAPGTIITQSSLIRRSSWRNAYPIEPNVGSTSVPASRAAAIPA